MAKSLRSSLRSELSSCQGAIAHWIAAEPVLGVWGSVEDLIDDLDRLPRVEALSALGRLARSGDTAAALAVLTVLAGPRAWRIVGRLGGRGISVDEDDVINEAFELLRRLAPRVLVMETFMWEVERRFISRHRRSVEREAWNVELDHIVAAERELTAAEEVLEVLRTVGPRLSEADRELVAAWVLGGIGALARRQGLTEWCITKRADRARQRFAGLASQAVVGQ